ncbi:M2 family metallopeptidase [Occallatibacter riparius]|uniref:M2 family metallopeptidase n=1 Tax=Occallatibacter riparius TaxID=1002689 RepID=A0A9J7BUG0_9BACT|nr:M2 family metallopeptidase [Occallatibacter riparius]UWZ85378.1 M2 family metallopeptidase [Occallatibacter riparius]
MNIPLQRIGFYAALSFAFISPAIIYAQAAQPTLEDARKFLDSANADLLKLGVAAAHAEWTAETNITGDTEATTARLNEEATARTLAITAESHRFDHLQLPHEMRRQIMLLQVNAPAAPKDPKLLAEETQLAAQLTGMYGKGKFCPTPDNCVGIDAISNIMAHSRDPEELTKLWVGWHAVGAPMRDKYARFMDLQNIGARELGYHDTGELWRAGYDMTPAEFSTEVERAWKQLEPLYRELHIYVRRRLIEKYGKAAERPDGLIPAQLLGNMWAQEWGNIYDIVAPTDPKLSQFKPVDLESALKKQIAEKDPAAAPTFASGVDLSSDKGHAASLAAGKAMVHYGEDFFKSLGFPPLPATFWERSQFVHPRDREVVCHASAWDVDNVDDLRVKMCIEVNADYFTTVHHELGHNFYQRAYNKQPYLFRNGANDGFHEAIGDSIALSITPTYLKTLGLTDSEPPAEADIPLQLRTALDKVAFLPFALALDKWRWQVFSGQIKPADYNKAWWQLRAQYQGVAPPVDRTEADFDAGAKNHIPTNVPYVRYFLARIYQFQFYKAMCDASGYKGALNRCSFYGSKAAGEKLAHMLEAGQSQPWQQTLKEMTGTDHLDAQPMLDYFAPLYAWLKDQNRNASH